MDKNIVNCLPLSEKIGCLKHTMDRYDHYYATINNKGHFFLTLNTFLLSGMITAYYSIKGPMTDKFHVIFFLLSGLFCCLLSIAFTLWSIIPYLNKESDDKNGSVIYFGNVSNISFEGFKRMYATFTEEKRYNDYLGQVYLLASGLQKKFRRLRIATYFLIGCFVSIIMIGTKILI